MLISSLSEFYSTILLYHCLFLISNSSLIIAFDNPKTSYDIKSYGKVEMERNICRNYTMLLSTSDVLIFWLKGILSFSFFFYETAKNEVK